MNGLCKSVTVRLSDRLSECVLKEQESFASIYLWGYPNVVMSLLS